MSTYLVYRQNAQPLGPLSPAALAEAVLAGNAPRESYVARVGDSSWQPLLGVAEITGALRQLEALQRSPRATAEAASAALRPTPATAQPATLLGSPTPAVGVWATNAAPARAPAAPQAVQPAAEAVPPPAQVAAPAATGAARPATGAAPAATGAAPATTGAAPAASPEAAPTAAATAEETPPAVDPKLARMLPLGIFAACFVIALLLLLGALVFKPGPSRATLATGTNETTVQY